VTYEEYKKLPAINSGAIKAGMLSMKHMRAVMTDHENKQTDAKRWGKLVHLSVLEPARFDKVVSVYDGRRAGKEWDAFAAGHDLEYIIKPDEQANLLLIRSAVHANSMAHRLIEESEHEVTIEWKTTSAGKCKARLDGLGWDRTNPVMHDLKSTSAIAPARFGGQFASLHYDISYGWYSDGVAACFGPKPVCYCIAVESKPPYDTIVYKVGRDIVQAGAKLANEIAARYRACEACNTYPGVDDGHEVVELVLPTWGKTAEVDVSNGTMEAGEL
jgi:hypothetical protein